MMQEKAILGRDSARRIGQCLKYDQSSSIADFETYVTLHPYTCYTHHDSLTGQGPQSAMHLYLRSITAVWCSVALFDLFASSRKDVPASNTRDRQSGAKFRMYMYFEHRNMGLMSCSQRPIFPNRMTHGSTYHTRIGTLPTRPCVMKTDFPGYISPHLIDLSLLSLRVPRRELS